MIVCIDFQLAKIQGLMPNLNTWNWVVNEMTRPAVRKDDLEPV